MERCPFTSTSRHEAYIGMDFQTLKDLCHGPWTPEHVSASTKNFIVKIISLEKSFKKFSYAKIKISDIFQWHVFILTKRINRIYGLGGMAVI